MRIAIVTQSYRPRPGGVTEHVYHLSRQLRSWGHHVTIITSRFTWADGQERNIHRLGRNLLVPMNGAWVNMTAGARLMKKLREILHELKPDLINTHCPLVPTLPLMAISVAPARSRIVGTFHAAAEGNFAYRLLRRPLGRFADRLDGRIAVSPAARRLAARYFPGHYRIIPNGVDTSRFRPDLPPIPELADGAFNILYVGRLDRRKGVRYLFEAVSCLSTMTSRRLRLIVVGEKGLRSRLLPPAPPRIDVVLPGIISPTDLPRYYASSHVFCSPAVGKESFGIVLLEAMASGLPVVATAIPGFMTLLKDRWNALLVPPRDPLALSRALLAVVEDDQLGARLASNALHFSRRYDWTRVAASIEDYFRQVVGLAPARSATAQNEPLWV